MPYYQALITRRRLLVLGLFAGLLVLGAGVWLLWPAGSVTNENYNRLRCGMTLRHAFRILGPPTDEIWVAQPGDLPFRVWQGDGVRIFLQFNENDTIRHGQKSYLDIHTGTRTMGWGLLEREGPLDVLRRWFGR